MLHGVKSRKVQQANRDATKNFLGALAYRGSKLFCAAAGRTSFLFFSPSLSLSFSFHFFFSFEEGRRRRENISRKISKNLGKFDTTNVSPFVAPFGMRVKAIGEERGESFVKEKHPTMRHVVDQFHL